MNDTDSYFIGNEKEYEKSSSNLPLDLNEDSYFKTKEMDKSTAIQFFTNRKKISKPFRFIESGYYKTTMEYERMLKANEVKHVNLPNKEKMNEIMNGLKDWNKKKNTSELDRDLYFHISVYPHLPYALNLKSPVDIPLKHSLYETSLSSSTNSLKIAVIVSDSEFEVYEKCVSKSEYCSFIDLIKCSELYEKVGVPKTNAAYTPNLKAKSKKFFVYDYDLLFCDVRIVKNMKDILGFAYRKKKGPRPVHESNLNQWIKNDLTHSKAHITQAKIKTSFKIARIDWDNDKIYENIEHILQNSNKNKESSIALAQLMEGKNDWKCISIHLGTSPHIHIYENEEIQFEPQTIKSFKKEMEKRNKKLLAKEEKKKEQEEEEEEEQSPKEILKTKKKILSKLDQKKSPKSNQKKSPKSK
jgi:hypothetical protein